MYELTVCAEIDRIGWLDEIGAALKRSFGNELITACSIAGNQSMLCVGQNAKSFRSLSLKVRKVLVDFFLGRIKYDYIEKRIESIAITDASRKLLCHALTVFDRETEYDIIAPDLSVGKIFSLDGFYRFRMRELKSRWEDICRLAKEHGAYLSDPETMNELIRFLVEAGRTDGSRADVFCISEKYRLIVRTQKGGLNEYVCDTFDDLLCLLIDISPGETYLSGFDYGSPFKTLNAIFDAKCDILR